MSWGQFADTLPLNMIAKTLGYMMSSKRKRVGVVVAVEPSVEQREPYGAVHGGLTATLLDSWMGRNRPPMRSDFSNTVTE